MVSKRLCALLKTIWTGAKMIRTIDGRLIPLACRNCHAGSQSLDGLCKVCLVFQSETGRLPHHNSYARVMGGDELHIERAKQRVRDMGLGRR